MTDATTATATPATPPPDAPDAPKDAAQKDAAPPKPDPKAELNERIKAAGLKLKAKDREVAVTSVDDLLSRANRVFGVESLLEEAKSTKAEAESVKAWRSAMEADDPEAAQEAFDALSPKAQRNALQWLQRKAQQYQEEEQLSPREKELRARLDDSERQRKEFEKRDAEMKRQREEAEAHAELQRAREEAAGTAKKVLDALKANPQHAPHLIPRIARVMRVAGEAGVPLTADEVANEVRESLVAEHSMLVNGMDGEGLIGMFGEEMAKKIAKAFLVRHRKPASAPVVGGEAKPAQADDATMRGSPRFFR